MQKAEADPPPLPQGEKSERTRAMCSFVTRFGRVLTSSTPESPSKQKPIHGIFTIFSPLFDKDVFCPNYRDPIFASAKTEITPYIINVGRGRDLYT